MSDSATLLNEGVALLRRGKTSKAFTTFERVHKADPANALGLSYLGVTMALVEKNYKDAEDYCFRAVLKSMGSAQLHANLAWVYYLQGKRKSTVDSLHEALHRDADNADALRIQGLIGRRRRPPVSFLSRGHPVNRGIGKLLHKMKDGR